MYIDMIRQPAPRLDGGQWLEGAEGPLPLPRGRPVFLDFWDFASLPSLAGIPYVIQWYERYKRHDVTFVGIQIPSYPFGGEMEHVKAAVRRLRLPYPILVDGEGAVRRAFNIQSVPSRYIQDGLGNLRFFQVGDEDYENTELFLQHLLREEEPALALPEILPPQKIADQVGGFTLPCTAEARLAERIGNGEEEAGGGYAYPESLSEGTPFLSGEWRRRPDARVLTGTGGVRIRYRAAEVYLLASHNGGATLRLLLDGRPLPTESRGEDVQTQGDGGSVLGVQEPRPYQVVRERDVKVRDLEVSGDAPGLALYSFQFVSRMPGIPS